MTLLFLSRIPANSFKFDLSFIDTDVFIFTDENYIYDYKKIGFKNIFGFKNYLKNDEVIFSAIQVINTNNIFHVIPVEESDVLRAALIRELTGLEGQSYSSALLYRDKYLMTRRASANVSVPQTELLLSKDALIDFFSKNNKLVVKPRDSWSSSFAFKITSLEQIENTEINSNFIIQNWIENSKLCTVDGIQKDGEIIWFCIHEYSDNLLDVIEKNKNGFAMMTSPLMFNVNLRMKIKKFTEKVLYALNNSSKFTAPFHLEFFLDQNETITLCEVASRFGGGRTLDLINNSYGFDITRIYLELLLNPEFKIPGLSELPLNYVVCYKNFFPNGYQIEVNDSVNIIEISSTSPKNPNRRIFNINDFEQILFFSCKSKDTCYEIINNFLVKA